MSKYTYGRIKDDQDSRDFQLVVPRLLAANLPPSVDLRGPFMPPIYDQGQIGSCTGQAVAAAFAYDHAKQGGKPFSPSRLWIYFQERLMEGRPINQDSGAMIRTGVKVVNQLGVPSERLWPYEVSRWARKPGLLAGLSAARHKAVTYAAVAHSVEALKAALAGGLPVIVGISVYESLESDAVDRTGDVPLPNRKAERLLGGHAILLIGYDDTRQLFRFRNSWSSRWGDGGTGTLPYAYFTDYALSSDFWILQTVDGTGFTIIKPEAA